MTATAARNGFPTDARGAAAFYLERGLAPIPLPARSKNPGYSGWEKLHLTAGALDQHFPTGEVRNIGILNGGPSHNHLDVDLDCVQALRAAPLLLPATGWVFGRQSAPRSHWIFKADLPLDKAQEGFEDLDGSMLVELRGSGGLTVFPPSTHLGTGERITWQTFTDPAEVTLVELERCVGELAAAVLLARHWPEKGIRDKCAMALTGALLRRGWSEEKTSQFVQAVAVAAGDEEVRMRSGKAGPAARKLEVGDKCTGWPTVIRAMGPSGVEIVKRVREWLGFSDSNPATDDLPLPEPPPWPDPPGEEAFSGLAGRIVRAIEPASEADPAALLIQTLVTFGNVIGRSAYFQVEADMHHGNEFVVLVGKTSKARKGTSWGRVSRLFREAEQQWVDERVQSGASSGEGIIWSIRDAIHKRERVKERSEDPRYVEVEADPGIADKRLLVHEPEYAGVLKQTERQGNTLSAVLRQAWDGGDRPLRTMTKNSPARATGGHVSLVGHITAEELRRYLTETETANGFANRFLWVCTDRSKLLPEGGHVDQAEMEGLRVELVRALEFAKSAGEVCRDEEARVLWCDIYAELSEGKPGLAGALLARAEAHVMRLALLYALLDCSATIQARHLLAAIAVWEYCERSVHFVFGDSLGDPVADELLRALRGAFPAGLTRTEISNYFQRNVPANQIGRALGLLLQEKLVRREPEQTGGRPSERWYALRR
jgi:hypothetical protein